MHGLELYLGDRQTASATLEDICPSKEAEEWFQIAALPKLKVDLINEATKNAARNLSLACDIARFGKNVNQAMVEKHWWHMLPGNQEDDLDDAKLCALYAVSSCLASGCAPKILERRIFLTSLRTEDSSWKMGRAKSEIEIIDEDKTSDRCHKHPFISAQQLAATCDSLAIQARQITTLDNLAGASRLTEFDKILPDIATRKIVRSLQPEALDQNPRSSADHTKAMFNRAAGHQLIGKLGLLKSSLLVASELHREIGERAIIIALQNSFQAHPICRLDWASNVTTMSSLMILNYRFRDLAVERNFKNWKNTTPINMLVREVFRRAKESLLESVTDQTELDSLSRRIFRLKELPIREKTGVESEGATADKPWGANQREDGNQNAAQNSESGTVTDNKQTEATNSRAEGKGNKEGKEGAAGKETSKRKRSPNSNEENRGTKTRKSDTGSKINSSSSTKKGNSNAWVQKCAEKYKRLNKADKMVLAHENIKPGDEPGEMDIPPSFCLRGLLGECANKKCSVITCKTFRDICRGADNEENR